MTTLPPLTVRVSDMHCTSCVQHITNALEKLQGVAATDVTLDDKTVTVTRTSESVDVNAIRAAISEAGYTAEPA